MCDLGVKKKTSQIVFRGKPSAIWFIYVLFRFFLSLSFASVFESGRLTEVSVGNNKKKKKKRVKRRKSTAAHTERKDYTKLVVMNRKEGSIGGPSQIQFRLFYKQIFPFCRATGSTWVERQQQPGKYSKNREEKDFVFRNQPTNTHTHTHYHDWSNKRKYSFRLTTLFPFQKRKKKIQQQRANCGPTTVKQKHPFHCSVNRERRLVAHRTEKGKNSNF